MNLVVHSVTSVLCQSYLSMSIFFKDYNDRYGHLQGDVCLITIAGQLRSMFSRASDFVRALVG
jgi:diguanylate cyclase (GGDEF)-like protein